ncbi:MAG: hypothetical protein WDN31_19435 [Hyphomicrobium sp.]
MKLFERLRAESKRLRAESKGRQKFVPARRPALRQRQTSTSATRSTRS